MTVNPYIKEINNNLPRLLALYDNDSLSYTRGIGDRRHWSWCLIDFGNGTFQGAVNGLSILLKHNLLPEGFSSPVTISRINAIIKGAKQLTRKDGSLEEAFPYEGSFCVTALVSYDLLSSVEALGEFIDQELRTVYLEVVAPMIQFILKADETHALISNHLATALAALCKWQSLTGEDVNYRIREISERIIVNQSEEGWFSEYGGFDPGYQSLCTYYLADAHKSFRSLDLLPFLRKSIKFLWHFAHPDGSFGGIYGSRNTRFYYPAGIEMLANEIPEAASLASYMRESIQKQTVVTLSSIDEPNLIPCFNSYCLASTFPPPRPKIELPIRKKPFRTYFNHAGILIDHGLDHHTIISTLKGGVVYHFESGKLRVCNTGIAVKSKSGKIYTSQAMSNDNEVHMYEQEIRICSKLLPVLRKSPKPHQFIILRLLNVTLLRYYSIRELAKQLLVKLLITKKGKSYGFNTRTITLGKNLTISDGPSELSNVEQYSTGHSFTAIHMASQGYWQIQDEQSNL